MVDGPSSVAEVSQWADHLYVRLMETQMPDSIEVQDLDSPIAEAKIKVTTANSGIGTAEMARHTVADVLSRNGRQVDVEFYSCMDVDDAARVALDSHLPATKAQHCFCNIVERNEASVVHVLYKMQDGAPRKVCAAVFKGLHVCQASPTYVA